MVRAWMAWAAAAVVFAALAHGLRPDTFYVGDPGVKLIAARDGRPGRPLEIPLPTIAGEPVRSVEPFFAIHGDHSHAVTSEIFPLASAPLIVLFGTRGAYLLPAIGFFVCLAACVRLAQQLDVRTNWLAAALSAALGTPFLFYGLEFWEHAPAVAVAATATYTWLSGRYRAPGDDRWSAAVSGFFCGIAILMRPEAIWFVMAAVAAARLLPDPPTLRSHAILLTTLLLTLLPLGLYSVLHFGTMIPPHVATNAGLLRDGWLASRVELLSRWFVPDSFSLGRLWGIALLSMIFGGWLASPPGRSSAFLAAIALLDIVLVVLTAPNDGGGQWGPRYLLFAFVPAAVLLAQALTRATVTARSGAAIVIVAIGLGGWVQRDGYRELRGTKVVYGRILDFVRGAVPPGGTVVTDLWWLDQVVAAANIPRILYAPGFAARKEIVAKLDAEGAPELLLIRSRTESPDFNPDEFTRDGFKSRYHPTCYLPVDQREVDVREIIAIRLRRTCVGQ